MNENEIRKENELTATMTEEDVAEVWKIAGEILSDFRAAFEELAK